MLVKYIDTKKNRAIAKCYELVGFSDKSQYKYFYRTIPTKVTLADVMLDFTKSQGWSNIGVIYSNDPFGQQCNNT